jgi:hypothetical protein
VGVKGSWNDGRNGGTMAEAQRKPRKKKECGKTGSTTGNGKGETASRKKTARKDGAEQLQKAADERVTLHLEELTDLLTKQALRGNLASAKVLVDLAKGQKTTPKPVRKRRGASLAEQWAAEPAWPETKE